MSAYASQFETLIQLSGTFVALISGFAISRYFSNFADKQKFIYERRLIEPKIETLGEQITSQREHREGNETARIFRELIDLFDVNDKYSDSDLLKLVESDFSEEELKTLISEFRSSRDHIDQAISEKAGALIPDPTEASLIDLEIPYTERNRAIYLDGLRRYRNLKRSSLGISNPFGLNLMNFDALTRSNYSIAALPDLNRRKRTESENVELFLEVEHQDKLLEAEIDSREVAMKMTYFVVSSLLTSLFGILIPTFFLIFPGLFNELECQVALALGTGVTVGSSFFYVFKSIQSAQIDGKSPRMNK